MKLNLAWVAPFLAIILLSSCSNKKDADAKGGKIYGGTLRFAETELVQNLFPHAITDYTSAKIAGQIFEGLFRLNPRTQSVEPLLCESYSIDNQGLKYIIKIKKGVFFHEDKCFGNGLRELKAKDVAFSFTKLCTFSPENRAFAVTFNNKVKGASEYYNASKAGNKLAMVSGIKVIDDYTIQIELEKPVINFTKILCLPTCGIFTEEAYNQYGLKMSLGTGPYKASGPIVGQKSFGMVKNTNYHLSDSLGNKLPFIDSLFVTVLASKGAELEAFSNGQTDFISGLPSESVNQILEEQISLFETKPAKYVLARSPELALTYISLNSLSIFKDKKLRQAFAYALDKEKIIREVLREQSYGPGIYGVTPPCIKNYDALSIEGYTFDLEKAKKLLAEAGYPEGNGFPDLKMVFSSGGTRNSAIAFEIQNQLIKNLNININLEIVPLAKRIEYSATGKADLFISSWLAEYESPESFLVLGYGKNVPDDINQASFPNESRYKNREYDVLFEKGASSLNVKEANDYFLQAEQALVNDCPIIPLCYEEDYKMYSSAINNFYFSPLRIYDFREVYLKKISTEVKTE